MAQKPRRRRQPTEPAGAGLPVPVTDLAADLLPFEREVYDRAVSRLVLEGCPPEFAAVLVWRGGDWEAMARQVLDAAVVDVDIPRKHVRLVPPPAG